MKIFLLLCTLAFAWVLPSCESVKDLFIGYTGNGVEITGMKGDLTGAGYNLTTKKAYLVFADGHTSSLKITGGGLGNGQLALYLEGGGKIIVDTKTGKITSGTLPGESPLPKA